MAYGAVIKRIARSAKVWPFVTETPARSFPRKRNSSFNHVIFKTGERIAALPSYLTERLLNFATNQLVEIAISGLIRIKQRKPSS